MKITEIQEDRLKELIREHGWAKEYGWWYKINDNYYLVKNKREIGDIATK